MEKKETMVTVFDSKITMSPENYSQMLIRNGLWYIKDSFGNRSKLYMKLDAEIRKFFAKSSPH